MRPSVKTHAAKRSKSLGMLLVMLAPVVTCEFDQGIENSKHDTASDLYACIDSRNVKNRALFK